MVHLAPVLLRRPATPPHGRRRTGLAAALLGVLSLTATTASSASAALVSPNSLASTSILCSGYTGCASAGMSSSGYSTSSSTMYWRMYAGHNCTNYAAYRMVRAGMPNVRPWTGSGNAMNWGVAMSRITDGTPTVGAVAWWRAHAHPAGSVGHVAYVEKVVSSDEIIVSQDSWGGTFSWARLTRTGGSWPSGFVHFHDAPSTAAVRSTAAPTLSGTPRVGSTLTASPGTWSPSSVSLTYQWLADGAPIAGATGRTLVPGSSLVGHRIAVRVVAARAGYTSASALSTATSPVAAPAPSPAITNSRAPSVGGVARVGSTLSATPGTWSPAPTTVDYRWLASGEPVRGATAPTLTLTPALLGQHIRVVVSAGRAGYTGLTRTSARTRTVAPGSILSTAAPAVSGWLRPGETLRVSPGAVSPADARQSVSWWRDGAAVPGATGTSYAVHRADVGHRLSAVVTATRVGYEDLVRPVETRRPVRSNPSLDLTARATGPGTVRLTGRVQAFNASTVSGEVAVRLDGERLLGVATLHHGQLDTTLSGLSRGHQQFRVRFRGNDTVANDQVWLAVRVS